MSNSLLSRARARLEREVLEIEHRTDLTDQQKVDKIIVIFSVAKLVPAVVKFLAATDLKVRWPGLFGNLLKNGEPSSSAIYNFQWLSSPGTLLVSSRSF